MPFIFRRWALLLLRFMYNIWAVCKRQCSFLPSSTIWKINVWFKTDSDRFLIRELISLSLKCCFSSRWQHRASSRDILLWKCCSIFIYSEKISTPPELVYILSNFNALGFNIRMWHCTLFTLTPLKKRRRLHLFCECFSGFSECCSSPWTHQPKWETWWW